MKCPYCSQLHPDGAIFCPTTGKSLKDIPTPQQTSTFPCPHCSKEIPAQAVFCPHCGTRFGTEELPTSQTAQVLPVIPKSKRLNPILIVGAVLGVALLVIGILLLTDNLPAFVSSKINNSQPTIQVLATVDINQFIETPTQAADLVLKPSSSEIAAIMTSTSLSSAPLLGMTSTPRGPTITTTPKITESLTPTISATLIAIEIGVSEKDQAEIVFIPAGDFLMGSDPDTDPLFWGAEGPSHQVFLDGYWIYRYEVTNAMFQACVSAGQCPLPESVKSRTRDSYYGNLEYADYPVIYVDYTMALSYCRWVGGRLPTEAEWERAARGDVGDRTFPWGSYSAEGNQANFCDRGCPGQEIDYDKSDGYRDTAPVGSYPDGVSPFGLFDMAGNVWEWVFDYFDAGYYAISPEINPRGPQSSLYRVIRGGGWNNPSAGVRIVQRTGVKPDIGMDTLGFRCALDVTP